MDTDKSGLSRLDVARQLLRDIRVESLRKEARFNPEWSEIYTGFRTDSLTRAIFLQYAHVFARKTPLLQTLTEVFLDANGVPTGEGLQARFAIAAGYSDLEEETRSMCRLLAEGDIESLELGIEGRLPFADDASRPPGLRESDIETIAPSTRKAAADPKAADEPPAYVTEAVPLEWEPAADQITEVQEAVTLFERSLSAFVQRQLEGLHGAAWLRRGCGDLRRRWKAKVEDQRDVLINSLTPTTLMAMQS